MLYEKFRREKFDLEQFKNPSNEFRGAPFWAWNAKLDKSELLRQIDCFREMGFGGIRVFDLVRNAVGL